MNRIDFAALCNYRGIIRAVEVGTDRGIFARDYLQKWHGELLVCIDPWQPYPHMPHDRLGDLLIASAVLAPFADRVRLMRCTSGEAARYLGQWEPGFVYIDGDHGHEAVADDMRLWWDLLPDGGILAGHDYTTEAPGVIRAVDEFACARSLAVQLTDDYNSPASWWIEKMAG